MTKNLWKRVVVVTAVVAVAGLAGAADPGRSEVAPGMPAPPDGGGAPVYGDATWPGPDGFGNTGSLCTYDWVDITGTGTDQVFITAAATQCHTNTKQQATQQIFSPDKLAGAIRRK